VKKPLVFRVVTSNRERQERRRLDIDRRAVADILDLARQASQRIDDREDRERTAFDGFNSLLGQSATQAMFGQSLHHFLGIGSEFLCHRFANRIDEPILAFVAFFHQHFDVPTHLVKSIADASRVLAGTLDDFNCVPDDVIAAQFLEPERLNPDAAFSDLRVPEQLSRLPPKIVLFHPRRRGP
jgi:hypothetical protein